MTATSTASVSVAPQPPRRVIRAALDLGAAVVVYPGDDWEPYRPSWHGRQIEFAQREGFVRLALAADVPIVPIDEPATGRRRPVVE